jgi:outer membrane protein
MSELLAAAFARRPDLRAAKLQRDAARRFAEAEARLVRPSLTFVGAAGLVPGGDPRLPTTYSAAGLNVSIPVFNGGLFASRRKEASYRAVAADNDSQEIANQIARQVRIAWLQLNTAARRIEVTDRLVSESNEALRLAQTRYENGLSSIVELSQAQLSQTAAQIDSANARYEYLSRWAALQYATGELQ